MSKLLFLLAMTLMLPGFVFAQSCPELPVFYFPGGMTHDFGTVPEGPAAEHVFEYINIGDAPLLVSRVMSGCGCLTPAWSKGPVLPGKKGWIKLSYHTQGRISHFTKSVTVFSNAGLPGRQEYFTLTVKGIVAAADTVKQQNHFKKTQ